MRFLDTRHPGANDYLDDALFVAAASRRDSMEHPAVETLLKGKEIKLPHGQHFFDKDSFVHVVRNNS